MMIDLSLKINIVFYLATEDFLKFEHTDGLNYVNFEIRNSGSIVKFKNWHIQHIEGLGLGIMIPKTNTTLMGMERHDNFHLSGYGFGGIVGLKFLFNFRLILFTLSSSTFVNYYGKKFPFYFIF